MANYIVQLSIERIFTTRAAAEAAWDQVETLATQNSWTVKGQLVKQ